MSFMRSLRQAILLVTTSACCLRASVSPLASKADGDSDISLADATQALSLAAKQAGNCMVYEGLPHLFYKKLLEAEILAKPTVLIDENWFYLPAQQLLAEDWTSLHRLFGAGVFKPWRGEKFCGGFHGDYAVNFESGGSSFLVLFCFGCHEARILRSPLGEAVAQSPPRFRLTVDLTDDGYKQLRELFKKYRKELPPMPDLKSKAKPPIQQPEPVLLSPGS